MSCYDDVLKIGKKLEKMISTKDVNESISIDLLNSLKKMPMTLEVLTKTKIGITVNTFRKLCKSDEVVQLSKALIKHWKKLLSDTQSSKSSSSLSSSASRSGGLDEDDSSRGSQPPNDSISQKSDSSSRDSEPSTASGSRPTAYTTDSVRIKCRELIASALRTPCDAEPASDIDEIAAAAEDAIFQEFKNTEMKYKNRIRSRVANLKDVKNPRLRENVLLGVISPTRLAVMTPDEMASDEMKQLRRKLTKEAIDDHQMAQQGGTKSDLFKCGRCGQRDTMYNQVQTRSADEPMTTFVLCNHCGNRWKFC
jgi:transcription elongation factor S-II